MFITSQALQLAAKLVTGFEGTRLQVYLDPAGIPTIGTGHKLTPQELRAHLTTVTPQMASTLLILDMQHAAQMVAICTESPMLHLNDHQTAALISLCFNIGNQAFAASTLVKMIRNGDVLQAADQFLVWDKLHKDGVLTPDPYLLLRRKKEQAVFLTPPALVTGDSSEDSAAVTTSPATPAEPS